jgi:protein-L-isoaspartate(D-aspartate) O-methyltransferase
MNIEQARFNMIEQQIRPWNVLDPDVLDLLVDTEIPLPGGEAMFTPKIEARMLQEVQLKKHENVLEVGTGSGYMAALLAHRARHVTTIEISPELKSLAEANLARAGISNVTVELGNGLEGFAAGAPFDVIVISGALEVLPEVFLKQLKVGGRIAAIIGAAPVMSAQVTTRMSETAYDTVKVFETTVKQLSCAAHASRFTF